jgi:DNA topoisomerase I
VRGIARVVARLRRSDCSKPGITRRRRGRGFSYALPDGTPVTDGRMLDRIRQLAIPPAWADVWISPWPNGHIQATGVDAAGRRQYRYHDTWRVQRDRKKFERVLDFARTLPKIRKAVERDLARPGLGRERVLAAIVRLLDVGYFRIGGEDYAAEHETYGVSSLLKEHVQIRDGIMVFDYTAKGSIERRLEVEDREACEVVASLRRRRSGGPNLFACKVGRNWVDLHAGDVNAYIKDVAGAQFSAKDFRTWSATVLTAAVLATEARRSSTSSRRAVVSAIKAVATQLGNTPAVCRSSYVDPRVVDCFQCGETIADRLPRIPSVSDLLSPPGARRRRLRDAIEQAVIDLLDGRQEEVQEVA